MTTTEINSKYNYLITPDNFTVAEYLNFGSRSVMPAKDRLLLEQDFSRLSREKQQRNLNVLFALQPYRDVFQSPIFITCGYRSERHELSRGRSGGSMHLIGAVDVTSDELPRLDSLAKDTWYGGYSYYTKQHFIHFDLGRKRRW